MWPFGRQRQEFIDAQKSMSDAKFLACVHADNCCASYITMIREIIAEMCKVLPEKIHPDTDTGLLYHIGPWNLEPWDDIGVIMAVEERLSVEIDGTDQELFPPFIKGWRLFRWGRPNWHGFGDYAIAVGQHMTRIAKNEQAEPGTGSNGDSAAAPSP